MEAVMQIGRVGFYDQSAGKKTVSLTINADLNRKIKENGINASQVAEEALAARLEQVSREKLAKAAQLDIEAYNAFIGEHGLFADMIREHEQDESQNA
jgi:antitoxin CcdA